MESVVKLVAFWTLGIFVVFTLYEGPQPLAEGDGKPCGDGRGGASDTGKPWILLILQSAFAIIICRASST